MSRKNKKSKIFSHNKIARGGKSPAKTSLSKKTARTARPARRLPVRVATSELPKNFETLSGFDKTRQIKVVFDVLYPELIEDVPADLSASPEERVAKYEAFMAAMQTAKDTEQDASVIDFYIPWNMLDFGDEFAREKRCSLDNVAQIVNNFADNLYEKPRVCAMPIYDENGKITDVKFWVANGWHRRTAKIELIYRADPASLFDTSNPANLRCSVSAVSTVKEAAECFVAQNCSDRSRSMSLSDKWRGRWVAREPNVVAVVNVARRYRFNAESPKGYLHLWPNFTSGDILERMMFEYRDVGVEVVERVLSLLANPACKGVYGKKKALDANFIGGLCHFIAMFERAGFAHDLGVVHMLSQEDIIDKLKDVSSSMSPDEARRELPDNCFGCWSREENKRFLSAAAAFSVIYSRYVPSPNSKSGFWSKCPSALRKLRHVAVGIADAVDREAYIANQQAQLAARGHAPCWPKYSAAVVAERQQKILSR